MTTRVTLRRQHGQTSGPTLLCDASGGPQRPPRRRSGRPPRGMRASRRRLLRVRARRGCCYRPLPQPRGIVSRGCARAAWPAAEPVKPGGPAATRGARRHGPPPPPPVAPQRRCRATLDLERKAVGGRGPRPRLPRPTPYPSRTRPQVLARPTPRTAHGPGHGTARGRRPLSRRGRAPAPHAHGATGRAAAREVCVERNKCGRLRLGGARGTRPDLPCPGQRPI